MTSLYDALPERGQRVVVDQLHHSSDPMSSEKLLTFMFADPGNPNLLWFRDENGGIVIIPRDPNKVAAEAMLFGYAISCACKSWRPFTGYAR